jgi:WG containing repeat
MRALRDLIGICALVPALIALACDARAEEIAIAAQFEAAGNFHNGAAPALLEKRWGLIDRSGNFIVRPRYSNVRPGSEGLFAVQLDGSWGYIDSKGSTRIAPRFEDAEPFQGGVAAVKSNGRWGYLRLDGTMETQFIFLEIGGREGAYVSARETTGWAVFKLRKQGPPTRVAIKETYDDPPAQRAYSISEGLLVAKFPDRERMLLIYTSGSDGPDTFTLLYPFLNVEEVTKHVSIRRMSEGFAPASTAANQWGYLHKRSREFLWPGRFQDAAAFAQGFAPVKIDGKWGYIDRAGRVVVQPTYDAAFPFRGDYAVVREGDKRGFLRLDQQGGISVFIAPKFEDASRFTEGLAPVKIGGRWGYISSGQPWGELRESGIVDIRSR